MRVTRPSPTWPLSTLTLTLCLVTTVAAPGYARKWHLPGSAVASPTSDASTESDLDLAEAAAVELVASQAREDAWRARAQLEHDRRTGDAPILVGLGLAIGAATGVTVGLAIDGRDWRGAAVGGGLIAAATAGLVVWYLLTSPAPAS
jgi:hypothetical protein